MDVGALAGEMVPYVSAVAGAYGGAVLEKLKTESTDAAADATVGLGRKLLDAVRRRSPAAPAIEAAVVELADDADDQDLRDILGARLKRALAADPELAAEIGALLRQAPGGVTITNSQGIQVGDHNEQTNHFGG
jgi:RIP homotypic interaction motif (RHIM)-containing protein